MKSGTPEDFKKLQPSYMPDILYKKAEQDGLTLYIPEDMTFRGGVPEVKLVVYRGKNYLIAVNAVL